MSATYSPAAKTERLMNLVMTLLYTRRPLSRARIRETVEQYRLAPTDEAFERMFERDKDELRELGIPLVTEEITAGWEDEPGYRIRQRDYALPQIRFDSDELAVLGLAARTWSHATLAGPASTALRKLRASGVEPDDEAFAFVEARLGTSEPAFGPLLEALLALTPVRFSYARPGTPSSVRQVQPWGLTSQSGHWYLTGFDTGREQARIFRLSRIVGKVARAGKPGSYAVPTEHDPVAMLRGRQEGRELQLARLRVRSGAGNALRRRGIVTTGTHGWDVIELPFAEIDDLAHEIASYGTAVVAQDPPDVRAAVRRVLSASAAAHQAVIP